MLPAASNFPETCCRCRVIASLLFDFQSAIYSNAKEVVLTSFVNMLPIELAEKVEPELAERNVLTRIKT